MTNKFSMKFQPSSKNIEEEDENKQEKVFVRDESDNKLFKNIQVKDIRPIITEDCVAHWDSDTMIWKACANLENKYIIVTHKSEGWSEEFSNISTFKGMGKGIKEKSWLGLKNMERELEGKEAWKLEDFDIENKAKLKYDEEKALEQAKIQIHLKMKQIRQQFGVKSIVLHTGSGDCFRHNLDLVRPYKGQRDSSARPIILKKIREWVAINLPHEATRDGFESDDRVEHYGFIGYKDYLKTGKFTHVVIASDKDAKNNPKLLIDPDTYVGENNPLKGKFKFPQAMLILDSTKDCGDVGIIQKENSVDYKFYGFKGLLWQAMCSGDGADNYNCLTHLQQNLNFGDESSYKLLKPCKTAKESLQAVINKFAELLPYGVQYTSHKGECLDVDTMTYMNTYFKVAYMTRSYDDAMDFYKLCEAMKVDTSKIVNNNLLTPPTRTFVDSDTAESVASEINNDLQEIISGIKNFSSMKKGDLVEMIKCIKENLESAQNKFENFYEMKQFKKEV